MGGGQLAQRYPGLRTPYLFSSLLGPGQLSDIPLYNSRLFNPSSSLSELRLQTCPHTQSPSPAWLLDIDLVVVWTLLRPQGIPIVSGLDSPGVPRLPNRSDDLPSEARWLSSTCRRQLHPRPRSPRRFRPSLMAPATTFPPVPPRLTTARSLICASWPQLVESPLANFHTVLPSPSPGVTGTSTSTG